MLNVRVIDAPKVVLVEVNPTRKIADPHPVGLHLDRVGGRVDGEALLERPGEPGLRREAMRGEVSKRRPVAPHLLLDAAVVRKTGRPGGVAVEGPLAFPAGGLIPRGPS